jgi:amidase
LALVGDEVTQALQPALARITAALGKPQPVTVSAQGLALWFQVFRVLQGAEVWAQHGEWATRVKPELGPGVRERVQWAATLTPNQVAPHKAQREDIARHMAELLCDDVVLVLPTMPGIAPLLNTPAAQMDDFRAHAMSLLCIAGLARLPQISLPLATLNGCPLGVSLVTARNGDTLLLEAATRIAAQ